MTDVQCRFTPVVGWWAKRKVYWGTCPEAPGGDDTAHRATQSIATGDGSPSDAPREHFDAPIPPDLACRLCGALYDGPAADDDAYEADGISTFTTIGSRWRTEDGEAHPGSLYWKVHGPDEKCTWENCEGRHLVAVCPDGSHWDVDARAGNCDRPDDHTHRCWVRDGNPEHDPPTVTAGKAGDTCSAGAGSIQTSDYHGFLRNGVFKPT